MSLHFIALINHFDDLNRAHEAVLKAKRQVELLTPLIANCGEYASLHAQIEERRTWREALKCYFANLKLELLENRVAALAIEWMNQDALVKRCEQRRDTQRTEVDELKRNIADNGVIAWNGSLSRSVKRTGASDA